MPRILPREYCSPISPVAFAPAVVSIFSSCIHPDIHGIKSRGYCGRPLQETFSPTAANQQISHAGSRRAGSAKTGVMGCLTSDVSVPERNSGTDPRRRYRRSPSCASRGRSAQSAMAVINERLSASAAHQPLLSVTVADQLLDDLVDLLAVHQVEVLLDGVQHPVRSAP